MNYCRICKKIIPRMHNGGPALRCSSCRAIKDDELQTAIEDTIDVFNESESAIEDAKRLSMRNKLLRQRNQVLLNDNKRLEAENQKLSKGVERLFTKINHLEAENHILKETCKTLGKSYVPKGKKMKKIVYHGIEVKLDD